MRNNTDNLDFYSPTMNLERDPRWGRTDEAYGEDPYLVSKEVDAYVDGLQGETPTGQLPKSAHGYLKAIATIKHFTAYNDEDNRLTGSSNEDPRTLREYDTMPFRDVVQQAHPGAVMSSYNEVNGTPSPADEFLNQSLMRETFGFGGYLTSDCDAVYEIVAGARPTTRDPSTTPNAARWRTPPVRISTATRATTTTTTTATPCRATRHRRSRPRPIPTTSTTWTPRSCDCSPHGCAPASSIPPRTCRGW
jgi:hypothetical protein